MPDVGVLLAETEQSLGADMRRRESLARSRVIGFFCAEGSLVLSLDAGQSLQRGFYVDLRAAKRPIAEQMPWSPREATRRTGSIGHGLD
jgi:hypothetical protein